MTEATVLVIGSVTADLTAISERRPASGETVLGTQFHLVAGGKGGNQAIAAARMGAATYMVGRTGEDQFGTLVRDALAAAGVRLDQLKPTPGVSTGVAHIRVDALGENDIVIVPLANASLDTDDVDDAITALSKRSGVLLTQLEIPVDTAVHALRRGRDAGLTTILDPAPAVDLPSETYPFVDILTPNETEAARLAGFPVHDEASARGAARELLDRGCRAVLVTLGASGSLLATADGETRFFAAPRVDAVDSTAAGDAFAGALGCRLAHGDPLADAIVRASAAGALATTAFGASSSIPSLDDVETLVASSRTEQRR